MKSIARRSIFLLLSCSAALAQGPATNGFRALQVDAGNIAGNIHSFQGVNGAPEPVMAGLPSLVRQYRELRISQVRTHDLMGPADLDSKFVFTNQELIDLIPDPAQRARVRTWLMRISLYCRIKLGSPAITGSGAPFTP